MVKSLVVLSLAIGSLVMALIPGTAIAETNSPSIISDVFKDFLKAGQRRDWPAVARLMDKDAGRYFETIRENALYGAKSELLAQGVWMTFRTLKLRLGTEPADIEKSQMPDLVKIAVDLFPEFPDQVDQISLSNFRFSSDGNGARAVVMEYGDRSRSHRAKFVKENGRWHITWKSWIEGLKEFTDGCPAPYEKNPCFAPRKLTNETIEQSALILLRHHVESLALPEIWQPPRQRK